MTSDDCTLIAERIAGIDPLHLARHGKPAADVTQVGAAILLGDGRAEQAELAHLGTQARSTFVAIESDHARHQLSAHRRGRCRAPYRLFRRELTFESSGSDHRRPRRAGAVGPVVARLCSVFPLLTLPQWRGISKNVLAAAIRSIGSRARPARARDSALPPRRRRRAPATTSRNAGCGRSKFRLREIVADMEAHCRVGRCERPTRQERRVGAAVGVVFVFTRRHAGLKLEKLHHDPAARQA